MTWQEGKKGKHAGRAIPNGLENKQVTDAMRAANVPATPENKEKVQQAIAGLKPTNKEVLEIVKTLFNV
jgi:hypothetical protein